MNSELFSIKYVDKHAAALIYKELQKHYDDVKLTSLGLENYYSKSSGRSSLKIIVALEKGAAQRLTGILQSMKDLLREHPLFPYLSFDFTTTPISQFVWNFENYDNENWQKVFIRKRKN